MEKRALIKFILYPSIFFCIINTSYGQSIEAAKAEEKITTIKEYPFEDYKDWSIIKRGKKEYVFDYIKLNPPVRITIEVNRKKTIKRISYVFDGSLNITDIESFNLEMDSTSIVKCEIEGLYDFIKNAKINQFHYIKEYGIYMFGFDEITVLYSPSIEASKMDRFKNYLQKNKNWYYYIN